MKVGILAGGYGTRLSEETATKAKPMVTIGGIPILIHLMRRFAAFGHREFVIALGVHGDSIRAYFDGIAESVAIHEWDVTLLDTGLDTMTGGRVKRIADHIGGSEPFFLTYGDGLADIDLHALADFHQQHRRVATVTAVHPPARFGKLTLRGDSVEVFAEKPAQGEGWINGGFFVLQPSVALFIGGDDTTFERQPLEALAKRDQLVAYRHEGFWACMDTLKDKQALEALWAERNPAIWEASADAYSRHRA